LDLKIAALNLITDANNEYIFILQFVH